MTLTLFVQSECKACTEIENFIQSNCMDCAIKDIEDNEPPVSKKFGIVLPALFYGDQLLAYGPEDILSILSQTTQTTV